MVEIEPEPKTDAAIEIAQPATLASPLIFASPHSGRRYSGDFLRMTQLDQQALRQSEDCYVDLLFGAAPAFGAPLLRALTEPARLQAAGAERERPQGHLGLPLPGSGVVAAGGHHRVVRVL